MKLGYTLGQPSLWEKERTDMNDLKHWVKLTLLLLMICSCTTLAQTQGGELVIAVTTDKEPDSLDPMFSNAESFAFDVFALMGGTAIQRDPESGELVPGYLESWSLAEDALSLTVTLKEGILFDSGEPLDAEALKFSWDRGIEDEFVLIGVQEISVVDPLTVQLTFSEENPGAVEELASAWWLLPVNPAVFESLGEVEYGLKPSSFGPWMIESWESGSSISLVPNPNYSGWAPEFYENRSRPYLDRMTYRLVPEEATALAAFEAGEVSILNVPSIEAERLKTNPDVQIVETLDTGMSENILFSAGPDSLTNELAVRLAVSHAIDRAFIIQAVLNGDGLEQYGSLHPQAQLYWTGAESEAPKFDLEKANAVLDEAGWTPGADGIREKDGTRLELRLSTDAQPARTQLAQIVQSQLRDVGIDVLVEVDEDASQDEKLALGDFDMMIQRFGGGLTDPRELWYGFSSASEFKNTFADNAELDALLEQQVAATTLEERKQFAEQVQQLISREALFFPVYIQKQFVAVTGNVENFMTSSYFIEPTLSMYLDTALR
jgi:peptide/nickel transport system substrate-binding protein